MADDKFEPEEPRGGLDYPCCYCIHRHHTDREEPCRSCVHNANHVNEAPVSVPHG